MEERDRDEVAANDKYAILTKGCKRRGKENAPVRGAVANLEKGKRGQEVQIAAQMLVKAMLVAGIQTETYTQASVLAETEEVSMEGENTDKLYIDTLPSRGYPARAW